MIKYILTLGLLLISIDSYSQISIGKEQFSSPSTLLEFEEVSNNTRGIILPAVTSSNDTNPTNGTFIYDNALKKVRMFENNTWRDLTGIGSDIYLKNNPSFENTNSQGVILGAKESDANGVLVLESEDKAMVLPKIANPHLNVKSPYPGMMCYDTVSKSLAVFDGANWNYWK